MWQESISGNLVQDLCNLYGITEPVNGSWIQAFCSMEIMGNPLVAEPVNGSWELGLLNNFAPIYNVTLDELIINGNIWQSIWVAMNGETQMAGYGFEGINYPINGNWFNNYYQLNWLSMNP